ncbi:AfsR/SARP family transcriptional regulator [Catellatospora vulcania]|uniref:AfsR/SARP family transcriptional regulator n=1 Tax=Catellatospora vulcania TaxID=1460450 RepID=UPI0012D396B6|nr:AfsR/SARP family transcriptional regulator [Catellatospora vulcania]
MITFGVLGPLAVHRDGQPVELPAAMPRRLLAALLSRANHPVSADRLADTLWDGSPPATARKTLQVYVHRLRTALGDPARVSHGPGGYLIAATADELDSLAFADLLGQARAARRAGDDSAAADLFEQALRLWRAEPYADLPPDALLADEVQRLSEEHLRAREESLGLRLDLGGHAEAGPELAALAAAHPYRESLAALLMLALYRSGRRADTLEVYRAARARLADELGIDAGAALRRVHAAVLRDDDRLDRVAVSDLDTLTEPAATGPAGTVPAQLPADTPVFSGRAAELDRLAGLLPGDRTTGLTTVVISAISGTAGVGKTTLAVHWAHRIAERFPDGQLYLNLRGFDPDGTAMGPAEAVRSLLDAFAVPPDRIPATLDGSLGLYRSLLAGKRVLVVLDNVRDAEHVRPLLPGSPTCLVLITSRNQLPALVATEGARPLTLDLLADTEAAELLSRRIGADRATAEPEAVARILRMCGGLPLALAIVAARAAISAEVPLAELADRLQAEGAGLDAFTGWDAATDVRAVFSWSYRALSAPAARMFRLLGLHPGPDLAVPAAASLAGTPLAQAQAALDELVRAHLVAEHAPGRYQCHDLLQLYAAELAETGEPEADRTAALGRLFDHYLHTAQWADRRLESVRKPLEVDPPADGTLVEEPADGPGALAWFTAEHACLVAALNRAAAAGWDRRAWQLSWQLTTYLDRRGHWSDLLTVLAAALGATDRLGDRSAQAHLHRHVARTQVRLGRHEEALASFHAALELYRAVDDHAGQGHTHHNLGVALEMQGRIEQALHHTEQALVLYTTAGYVPGQARALNGIGWYRTLSGEHRAALEHCGQALELFTELGDRQGQAHTLDSLGYAHAHLGEHIAALARYEQAVALYRDFGDLVGEAATHTHLGDSHQALGDPAAAALWWRRALDVYEDLGRAEAAELREKLRAAGLAVTAAR